MAETAASWISNPLPANSGSLTINANGTFSFNPGPDFQDLPTGDSRSVSFTYTATDQHSETSNVTTVTIVVAGANDVPVAGPVSVSAVEDGGPVDQAFNASDADSDDTPATLSYAITGPPSEGLVGDNGDGMLAAVGADRTGARR